MSGNFLRTFSRFSSFKSVNTSPCVCRIYRECYREFHQSHKICSPTSIMMPSLSPTMTEGAIKKWVKQEGDEVNAGDVLLVLETDKADMEMEADEDGVLAKILVPAQAGALIPVGQLIGVMADEGEDWKSVEIPQTSASSASPQQTSQTQASPEQSPSRNSLIGPAVRKLMEEYGVEIKDLQASGPHGSLLKGDVMEVIKSKNLSKVQPSVISTKPAESTTTAQVSSSKPIARPGEMFIDIPHSNMRKTIAKRLTRSKNTVPHTYASISCEVDKVIQIRRQLLHDDIKVSVNDFIIKAAAIALQQNPTVNSVWQGDTITISSTVDVSIAVATPNGLITPIVKNAAYLGVQEISHTVREMAHRAREGKLQPHEYQGGSFSISNLGMFGISEFTAVINPPQCAILAVGSSRAQLGLHGRPVSQLTVQLSYDGRVIDHTEASQFLESFRAVIETPSLMLSGAIPQQAATL